jgi:type I restriction enzyme S subunit
MKEEQHISFHGWILTSIGEVSIIYSGGTPDRKVYSFFKGNIPWVKSGELNYNVIIDTEEYLNHIAIENSSAKIFPKGTVLIALYGTTVGKSAILGIDATTNQAVAGLITTSSMNNKYLYYFLMQNKEFLLRQRKGAAQPNINLKILAELKIPLPPLKEQDRIVEKIEELFSEIEYIEKSLFDINKHVEIYWQSILKSTYSFIKDKIKLGDIAEIIMGQSPIGSTYNNKGVGTPLINGPMEFGNNSFSKTILSKWTTKPTKICNEGDIIICVRGSTTGRLNVAGFNACIGRGVAAIQPCNHIYKGYLLYYLHYIEKDILKMGTGTTFPSVSKEQLNEVIIPLCSYNKQVEFVNSLDSKYTIIENTKSEIGKIFEQIETLKQSILYKAFIGELVSQNPSDEPAYQLLEKIKMERLKFLQNKPKENRISIKIKKMEHTKSVLDLLKEAKEPIPAKEIWQQSKHWESIDNFYTELKSIYDLIEQTKTKTETLLSLKK